MREELQQVQRDLAKAELMLEAAAAEGGNTRALQAELDRHKLRADHAEQQVKDSERRIAELAEASSVQAGPAITAEMGEQIADLAEAIVADEVAQIQQAVRSFSAQGCGLILTTGGTGIAERDVTPEALRGIMRVEIPGFGEVMRAKSLALTPNAILSRCLAAIVDHSLVIALPGKPQGAVDCLSFVSAAIPHSVKLAMKLPTSC
ncbi:MAG: MogA/MoaB family molybdenum cofactor biosynthesis protein, partial [Roseimicrobium sp.]